MRRLLLMAFVGAATFALTGGTAGAAVQSLDLGGLTGLYTVLNNDNQPALQGPRVAFFTDIDCSPGQEAVVLVVARQGGAVGPGGGKVDCTGDEEQILVAVRKNQGSPNFTLGPNLNVEGVGMTDVVTRNLRTTRLNDMEFDEDTLGPLSPGGDLPFPLPLP